MIQKKREKKINPKVKQVIGLLGVGTFLAASLVFPGLPIAAKFIIDEYKDSQRKKELGKWEKFNLWRLRATLKRLYQEKIVEVKIDKDQEPVVVLTSKGKTHYLKSRFKEMITQKPPRWDGKWRLVIYDIADLKKTSQQAFRQTLKELKFLRLQNSVYLYPYPCADEIEFLRQFYGIGEEVLILTVAKLENEEAYKKYFGL
jgi:DNA-binding transcriptional regulator PaaX